MLGLKQCREQAKAGQAVFMMTDKSKKISADSIENFVEAMKDHTKDNSVGNKDDLAKLKKNLNGHSIMLSKFLMIGRDWGH